MTVEIIDPLDKSLQALRSLQCPDHIQLNDKEDAYRVSSGAFIPGSDDTISVDLEESLLKAGLNSTSIYGHLARSVALVGHTIQNYEQNSFSVSHTPIKVNEHHGSVSTGLKNKALRKAARAMAKSGRFLVEIDPVAAVALGAPPLKNLRAA